MTSLNAAAGNSVQPATIAVIVGNWCATGVQLPRNDGDHKSALKQIPRHQSQQEVPTAAVTSPAQPTLYVLNATSLAKPYAIQHLTADLISYDVHIAVITETHLKKTASGPLCSYSRLLPLPERSCWLKTRWRRRVRQQPYVSNAVDMSQRLASIRAAVGTFAYGVHDVIVGTLYHPPKPLYQTPQFLNHIEACVDTVESTFPDALVILAGSGQIVKSEQGECFPLPSPLPFPFPYPSFPSLSPSLPLHSPPSP